MGISVSVDSWVEQILTDLCEKSIKSDDITYSNLLKSTSSTSEIFMVPAKIMKTLVSNPKGNLNSILIRCLEGLNDSDAQTRINSAAILSKLFPFMIKNSKSIDLMTFLYDETQICGDKVPPADYIITIAINTLISFGYNGCQNILTEVERNEEIFDLLAFTVFSVLKYYENLTVYHSLLVYCTSRGTDVIEPLFNYIHSGGRSMSLISLFGLLLFHPSDDFKRYTSQFVENGGVISANLCTLFNDDTDFISYLTSLGSSEKNLPIPISSISNPDVLRLGLLKIIVDGEPYAVRPNDIFHICKTYDWVLAKYLYSHTPNLTQEQLAEIPINENITFLEPRTQEWFLKWVTETISQLFLYGKSLWFVEADATIELPSFEVLDHLAVYNSA